jgi:hypothetical protein
MKHTLQAVPISRKKENKGVKPTHLIKNQENKIIESLKSDEV